MSAEKFLTRDKLIEYLNQEIEENLDSCNIRKLSSYGWLDDSTPDPKFIGYAMYDIDPIYMEDWESLFGDRPVKYRPTDIQKYLMESSTDFIGLMELSRISIGLTLLNKHIFEENFFDDNEHFWLNFINSSSLLSMASDRLRDFFVMAVFNVKYKKFKDKYNKKYKQNPSYQAPFLEVKREKGITKITETINNISLLSIKIMDFRKKRNKIVHDIATKYAKDYTKVINGQQNKFDREKERGFEEGYWEKNQSVGNDSHKSELQNLSNDIIEWYKILIDACNYAFQIENYMRRQFRA